jgi:mitosis inhibitor protein kinase SWE1
MFNGPNCPGAFTISASSVADCLLFLFTYRGEPWHRLRREDFGQVELDDSPELLSLIKSMMKTDPILRINVHGICAHPVVSRTRSAMERKYAEALAEGTSVFVASPLSGVPDSFLEEILGRQDADENAMDLSD